MEVSFSCQLQREHVSPKCASFSNISLPSSPFGGGDDAFLEIEAFDVVVVPIRRTLRVHVT